MVFLEISQNSQENICARVSFFNKVHKIHRKTPVSEFLFLIKLQPETCKFIKKENLAQLFSCEFREISKNTLFTEHLWTTASVKKITRGLTGKPNEINDRIRELIIENYLKYGDPEKYPNYRIIEAIITKAGA